MLRVWEEGGIELLKRKHQEGKASGGHAALLSWLLQTWPVPVTAQTHHPCQLASTSALIAVPRQIEKLGPTSPYSVSLHSLVELMGRPCTTGTSGLKHKHPQSHQFSAYGYETCCFERPGYAQE